MSKPWPRVKLEELLKRDKSELTIQADVEYKRLTIRMGGQGVSIRDRVLGIEIGTKRQFKVKAGQFLLSKIDARNGAFGIVPTEGDYAIVTGNFWSFDIAQERVLPRFIEILTKTPIFVDYSIKASSGTTNRLYLQEEKFSQQQIALPPIEEQQRIVARIEEIASQIAKVERLRASIALKQKALCRSLIANDPGTKFFAVADVVRQRALDVIVQPDQSYQFAGVYSFGKGVFKGQIKSGVEFAYPKLSRVKAGDFIYPKLMAWEGALGVVPPECDGCVVSPEFPVFEIDGSKVLPEVFDVHFRDPRTWESLQSGSTGTNARRRRLNPADFLKLHVPVPSQETQRKLSDVRRLQSLLTAARPDATGGALLASVLNQLLAQTRNTQSSESL